MENKIEKGLLGYSGLTSKDLESGKLAILRDNNNYLKVTLIHKAYYPIAHEEGPT